MARVTHPLEPLSAEEIARASAIVKREHLDKPSLRFPLMMLAEPPKDAVREFKAGASVDRQIAFTVLDRADGEAYRGVVSLGEDRIVSWDPIEHGQPPILIEEFEAADAIVKSDPAFVEALARRGITDLEHVQIDLWSAGDFEIEGVDPSRRYARTACYVRDKPTDNGYARPIENVHAIVDLNEGKVIKVLDGDVVPIPAEVGNFDAESVGQLRTDLKPLEITQPEGTSFSVDGNLVHWQKWSLRVSLHATEGLVLHQVPYDDDGEEPIDPLSSKSVRDGRALWRRRATRSIGATPSMPASTGWAAIPDHSRWAVTALARSSTSTQPLATTTATR